MDILKEIKRVRREAKMTQGDMAAAIGMSRQAYSMIERGRTKVTVDHLKRIDSATGKQLVITFIDKL